MIHPIIRRNLTTIILDEFGGTPKNASDISDKILKALARKDMQIIRGEWAQAEEMTWETLARDADAWINGPTSPLNTSELK